MFFISEKCFVNYPFLFKCSSFLKCFRKYLKKKNVCLLYPSDNYQKDMIFNDYSFVSCSAETICNYYLQQAHSGANGVTHWVSALEVYSACVYVWERKGETALIRYFAESLFFLCLCGWQCIHKHLIGDPVWILSLRGWTCMRLPFFPHKGFLSSSENAIHVCSIGGQACAVPSEHVDLTHHVRLLLRE